MKVSCESRYGDLRTFYQEQGNWYFDAGDADAESMRYGLSSKAGEYSFVDPRGGPMVSVGERLCKYDKALPDQEILNIVTDYEKGAFRLFV